MSTDFPDFWTKSAEQFQQTFGDSWNKALQAFAGLAAEPGSTGAQHPPAAFSFDSERLQAVQQQYLSEATQLWNDSMKGPPALDDRRFSAKPWTANPISSFAAATYLVNARALMGLVDAVETDEKVRNRIRFALEQWLAATAPSNYLAFNAEAQQKAVETQGESITRGVKNLLHDLRQGHVSQTDEQQFEVGVNVATSEGAVVFENELFQLIEYKPKTAKVHERPLLVVPPCINKFYILDLQPENSLLAFSVAQGHRTFVISWRNPDESLAQTTWDDYVEKAVIEAIHTVQDISDSRQINTLGFCVGGTLLATALGVLAARGEQAASSMTLLTTFLDFSDTGVLDIFIDEAFVRLREMQFAKGGILKGQELASTFSFLRPNELVWNYVVGNYLKGETPPPFDLLYWNSDSTNLPGPMYAWYLRNTYLENRLAKPGGTTVCGEALDLGQLKMPVYLYGSREDHIVPIGGAYASTQLLKGPKRFVMGASGHIAGVINPPAKKKRSHWVRERLAAHRFPATLEDWLSGATEKPGSWWTDWAEWLQAHAGSSEPAPKQYGRARAYTAIEPAPGRYVRQKAA